MKFSLEWLGQYVDTGRDPAEIGTRLTAVGIAMDTLERNGDDTIFDFDVTTNRPDCMNHLGLARELSVATGRLLKEPPAEVAESRDHPAARSASVEVQATDLCGRYTARVIHGVHVGPSPGWLTRRLDAIGLRPINAVVDATNYVLWEMGHPLHAFDLARLEGQRILVRRARPGENLTTLDGVARKLHPDTLIIADARRAVAIAGVMGGADSEISMSTTDVLLESAHFQPTSVRKTARSLGLHTDASHRFERGADVEITRKAVDRCARLIAEITGGRVAGGALDHRTAPPFSREIALRPERVRRLLGLPVPETEMKEILERLGCNVRNTDPSRWPISTPSFRLDLALEEDLIEEIARHYGYERIPTTLPRVFVFPEGRPESERRVYRIRQAMARAGFSEALNLSLVGGPDNLALGESGEGVRVTNPLTEGQDRLRTTLVPGLLRNLAHNLNRGALDVRLFETGKVFRPSRGKEAPLDEEERVALACGGKGGPKHWSEPPQPPGLFDLKGAIDLTARLAGLPPPGWRPAERPFLARGAGAEARIGGDLVGWAGQVDPGIASGYEVEGPAFIAEVSLRSLFASLPAGFVPHYAPLVRTPSVSRDLSLILEERHSAADVEQTIRGVEGAPITRVTLFDRYRGKPVPPGKVSLSVNIVFQNPERTLVSGEVSEILDRIVQRLRDRLGAVLRAN